MSLLESTIQVRWRSLQYATTVLSLTCSLTLSANPVFAIAEAKIKPAADASTEVKIVLPDFKPKKQLETAHAPGRFIVKFADTVTEPADVIHGLGLSFATHTPAGGEQLDALHKKHKIKAVKPLFRQFFDSDTLTVKKGQLAKRKKQFFDQVAKTKMKYQRRTLRASRNSQVPDLTNVYVFETPPDADVAAITGEYAANPNVLYAVPALQYKTTSVTDDPFYFSSGSWGNLYDDLWGLKKIGVEAAWDFSKGQGVVVAVVDTGLDYGHPDISANVWTNAGETNGTVGADDDGNGFVDDDRGWNFASNNNDATDHHGHGTHVAGTIAATGNNGIGVVGVAYQARILPVKGLNDSGIGLSDNLANAILYAAANGAEVINNSWGGMSPSPGVADPVIADAISAAHALGIVVVVAAGNDSIDALDQSPANIQEVVTVGASGAQDAPSWFSNWGNMIDLVAPGGDASDGSEDYSNILSLRASGTGDDSYAVGTDYIRFAGTSMAAPHVSGVAALLIAANPELTREQIVSILRHSADDLVGPPALDTAGHDPYYGWGRLNAARALSMAFTPPADPPIFKVQQKSYDFHLPYNQCGENRSFKLDVFNLGGGTLNWSAEAPGWLTVSPASGGTPVKASVSYDSADSNQGSLALVCTGAANGRQEIPVSGTVMQDVRVDNCDMIISNAAYTQAWQPWWHANSPAIPDGQGGAFYVFNDGYYFDNLSMQRIDSHGKPLWRANGINITNIPSGIVGRPAIASDGAGGAFVTYLTGQNGEEQHVKVQRVGSDGTLPWGNQGIWVTQAAGGQQDPEIAADGTGGAVVSWVDYSGGAAVVMAQRINGAGQLLWPGGVPVTLTPTEQYRPMVAGDGNGGAIVAWVDYRRSHYDVYAQHIDGSGSRVWADAGMLLNPPVERTGGVGVNIIADGAGGAIIGWRDFRNYLYQAGTNYLEKSDIYAVRLTGAGQHLWAPQGVPVLTGLAAGIGTFEPEYSPYQLTMSSDGAGGALFVWHDSRNSESAWDIYAQRLNAQGNPVWQVNGAPVTTAPDSQVAPSIAADNEGGAYVAWADPRSGSYDIFMQHLSAAGAAGWGPEGTWMQSAVGDQYYPFLVGLAGNRVALTWDDGRNAEGLADSIDLRGKVIQSCSDRDGNGYYDEGGVCNVPYRISVTMAGTGAGSVASNPAGLACGASCEASFPAGATITLTATGDAESNFTGWAGACSGTGPCTIFLTQDTQVTATFSRRPLALNYTKLGPGTGTVTMTPGGSCSGDCTHYYNPGDNVTLTAAPGGIFSFKGWSGACSGTGPCTIAVDGDRQVSATFAYDTTSRFTAGEYFSLALKNGAMYAWGDNYYRQLGDGTTTRRTIPVQNLIPGDLTGMTSGPSARATLGIKQDGTVLAWGDNSYGQLGDGSKAVRTGAVQVQGLSQVTATAAGATFSLALTSDGRVWAWGYNSAGQLGGNVTERLTPGEVTGVSGVTAIAAGAGFSVALKSDGTVWTWGNNNNGQLGDGKYTSRSTPAMVPGLSGVVAIAAGGAHVLAVKGDGTLWSWGWNYYGQLGNGALTTSPTPTRLQTISAVAAVAAGDDHSLALTTTGTLYAWGANSQGQVGGGSSSVQNYPLALSSLGTVSRMAAGRNHNLAETADGKLWAWGENTLGQIGDGTNTNRKTPVQITIDTKAPTTTASPAGGTYTATQAVTLSADETATIYYTLDGSSPTTASAVYSAPLTISATKKLRYFAKDAAGNSEAVKEQSYIINLPTAPVADFSASVTSGTAPVTVSYRDLSTGQPTAWQWNFGDASTGTLQHPDHTYNNPGVYTVSLTATNAAGNSTVSKTGYITVNAPVITLQDAYNAAADRGDIKVRALDFYENPIFDRDIMVRISGGYDGPHQQVVGATVLHGKLTVRKGSVSLGNVVVK